MLFLSRRQKIYGKRKKLNRREEQADHVKSHLKEGETQATINRK